MIVTFPSGGHPRRPFEARVVAYVNESAPVLGQDGLRDQIRAVAKRARRDGVVIGLTVIESGGQEVDGGMAMRLGAMLDAARGDPAARVLYVADPTRLASGPGAALRAMDAIFNAGFELRAPCGRISPVGRRVAKLRAAAAMEDRERAKPAPDDEQERRGAGGGGPRAEPRGTVPRRRDSDGEACPRGPEMAT